MREEGDQAEPRPALAVRRGMTQRFPWMGLELRGVVSGNAYTFIDAVLRGGKGLPFEPSPLLTRGTRGIHVSLYSQDPCVPLCIQDPN